MNALLYPDQRNSEVSPAQNPVAFWLIAALESDAYHRESQALLEKAYAPHRKPTKIHLNMLARSVNLIYNQMASDIRNLVHAGGLLYLHDHLTQQHLDTLIAGGAA